MSREDVLIILSANRDKFVSGREIGETLGISRAAVSEHIKRLAEDGYSIEAVTNRGYKLVGAFGDINKDEIVAVLGANPDDIHVFRSVDSTNLKAREFAEDGAKNGTVVVSGCQTSGRGRRGRSFVSPQGSGVYFSVILRPDGRAEDALYITVCAAVAAAETAEQIGGRTARIKWVNDIFVGGKKVCGILTEGSVDIESGALRYAVLGIGVNVTEPVGGFDKSISDVAGAVLDENQTEDKRARFAAETVKRFFELFDGDKREHVLTEYKKRSLVTGKYVDVIKPTGTKTAFAEEIDDSFRLVVRYENGEKEALSSGEISVRTRI